MKGSKNCLLIHVLGRNLEKTHDALGSDSSESIPNHSARALQALGDHEAAQAREQDPQILRRHCRDDLLLTHQQEQAVAVEPHGTHQNEKDAAQPADQAAGKQREHTKWNLRVVGILRLATRTTTVSSQIHSNSMSWPSNFKSTTKCASFTL